MPKMHRHTAILALVLTLGACENGGDPNDLWTLGLTTTDDTLLLNYSDMVGYERNNNGDTKGTMRYMQQDHEFAWDAETKILQITPCNENEWTEFFEVEVFQMGRVDEYIVDCSDDE